MNTESQIKNLNCLNCQRSFRGSYCGHCGQRAKTKRLSAGALFGETLEHVFDLETPLIRTTLTCLYRPGWVARQYVLGRRRAFSNPFKFCLLAIAFYVLVVNIFGFDLFEAVTTPVTTTGADNPVLPFVNDATRAALDLSVQYAVLFSFAMLPFYALLLYLLFWHSRWNFVEFFVLAVFVTGVVTLTQVLVIAAAIMVDPRIYRWGSLVLLSYYFIAPLQFCEGHKLVVMLKSALIAGAYFVVQGVFIFGVGVIAVTVSREALTWWLLDIFW